MNELIIEQNIKGNLDHLSEDTLKDLKEYIDHIIEKKRMGTRRSVQLKGVWENIGFENLDVEKEISELRKNVSMRIANRLSS